MLERNAANFKGIIPLDRALHWRQPLMFAKVGNHSGGLINTRLQPGGESARRSKPFQRLAQAEKPLKRFS